MRSDFNQNCELLARAQKCFAADVLEQGIIDELIPMGGSDADCAKNIKAFVLRHLENFRSVAPEQLALQRQRRFADICNFATVENVETELKKAAEIANSTQSEQKKKTQSAPVDADVKKALEFVAKQTLKARESGI